jgi:uncharacterized protein (DUF2141 family)
MAQTTKALCQEQFLIIVLIGALVIAYKSERDPSLRSVANSFTEGANTMNRYMNEKWPWIEGTHGLRTQMLDTLSDAELAFNPGGQNMTLGALCREMGEIEYSYNQSLKTFRQDWSYRNTEAGLESSISRLKAWFQTLDDEMKAAVSAFSDEDLNKTIDRGGFSMPVELQLDVYLQALLIFFGKATIYFKAMNKALPQTIQEYIW